tara:strand:+ start:15589 stop:15804 length:216 start_codon:yes stop_codon:yes gene_type:complete
MEKRTELLGEEVFDREQAAAFLKVSPAFISRQVAKGYIKASKLGASDNNSPLRIKKSALIEFMDAHEVQTA